MHSLVHAAARRVSCSSSSSSAATWCRFSRVSSTRTLSYSYRPPLMSTPATAEHRSAPQLQASALHAAPAPLQVYPALMSVPQPSMYPFGSIPLPASNIFFATPLSYASVNLSPILPGHVLIMPRSNIARVTHLPADQLCDLWLTAQFIGRVLEQHMGATALTLAIQDGAEAGQTIPCVHLHLIPRHPLDIPNKDDIYAMLEDNVPAEAAQTASTPGSAAPAPANLRSSIDDSKRVKRSLDEMTAEAKRFAQWLRDAGVPPHLAAHTTLQMVLAD